MWSKILWMVSNSTSHHFEPMVEAIVCWYLPILKTHCLLVFTRESSFQGAGFHPSTVWTQLGTCCRLVPPFKRFEEDIQKGPYPSFMVVVGKHFTLLLIVV